MNAKEYVLEHYNEYGIKDRHDKPITQKNMRALLNILESQEENFDDFLEEASYTGLSFYFGIMHTNTCISDTYDAIIEHFTFYSDEEFINDFIMPIIEENEEDIPASEYIRQLTEGEIYDTTIYKTSDGYVVRYDF